MHQLPSRTLRLLDSSGTSFGYLRFAPRESQPSKGDCLFDILPESQHGAAARSEARWLAKRHYVRWSEHKYKLTEDGTLTVSQGDFRVVFHIDEEDTMTTRPPAPPITGVWTG